MGMLAVFPAANGLLQVIQANVTLWQTNASNPGAFSTAAILQVVSGQDAISVTGCQQEDGTPQIWECLSDGSFHTGTTASSSPGTGWAWKTVPPPHTPPGNSGALLAAGTSTPGKVQVFGTTLESTTGPEVLQTFWQTTPNKEIFTAWESFSPSPGSLAQAAIAPVHHPTNGLLQLFASTAANELITSWKEATDPNAPWSNWTPLSSQPKKGYFIAGAARADGRIQLWSVLFGSRSLATTIQVDSSVPSATFPGWTSFSTPDGVPLVSDLAAARLTDGRIQLFIIASTPAPKEVTNLYTCYQKTTASSSEYTAWEQLNTHT